MNIHHLELFYYVARFGGISEAVRNIPYGIQQPAVSGQIAQLEEFLGTTLFHRRPFSLTPPGEKLYNFIKPFFAGLDTLTTELQGGTTHQVRIGSSDVVLRDHLPELLQIVKKKFPQVKVALREGYQPELESMLQKQEIDLAVTLMEKKAPAGLHTQALLELPLILMVDKESPITSAEELWKKDRIQDPLICLPESEAICKNFQQGLSRLGVDWFPSIEVSSVDIIQTYVTSGFGIGLTVSIPKTKLSPKVRTIPLPNFTPVVMGALWRGKLSPPMQLILEELQRRARVLSSP
jgi:DNA-binding transcriptional LysR family regulator